MAKITEISERSSGKNSEELNDILQSALDDFDSCSVSSEATSSENITVPSECDEKLQEDFEDKFTNLLLKDMDDTAFSSQMSNLLSEVQNGIQTYVNNPNSPAVNDNTDSVSHAINSLMQNIEQIKDNMKNESQNNFNMGVPFMEQMFQMLMSKEVLYPSLLSVKEKYPSWLRENKGKIGSDELRRYTEQYDIIRKICVIFESECNSDSEEVKHKKFLKLVKLLQEMTDLGQPPQDLAESFPTGAENDLFGADLDMNSCNTM